jgi:hypothetical protein
MALITRVRFAATLSVLLVGCATSSHVLIGTARAPISPELVKVYLQPPAKYEQIATIDASSRGSLTITSQQNMDKAIARLKQEAARLGANGILLQGIEDQQSGAIGTGVGNSSFNGNTAIGASLGGSFGIYNKAAKGLAIYVAE